VRAYLETLRPRQWIKNLVIFAGLVFDRQLLQPEPLLRVAAAVILFCLVSGLTYTINDILDVESDRMHPQKKNRPIASGKLSPRKAGIFAAALSLFTFPAAFALSIEFGIICLVYTALMLSYSKWLKKIILIDVMVIALGFVLRVAAGVMVIKVTIFLPGCLCSPLYWRFISVSESVCRKSNCWKTRLASTARYFMATLCRC